MPLEELSFPHPCSRRRITALSFVLALTLSFQASTSFAAAKSTSSKASSSSTKAAASSTTKAKPVLKAIDPAQARMDTLPGSDNPAPSPNPLGGISGAPVSGDNPRSVLPQSPPSWPSYPPGQGYPPASYVQQQAQRPAYALQYHQPYQQPYQPPYQQPYQPPSYQAQNYQQPVYQPPAYPPPQTYQQPYPPQQQYQYAQPSAPPQYAPQQSYGAYGQPNPYQGQASGPAYGGPQQPPANQQVVSPPGYPTLPPGGFNNAGPVQQSQGQDYPSGRARLGGGHPNLVPQGPPPGYPAYPNAYPAPNQQYPPQQQYQQQQGFGQSAYNPGFNRPQGSPAQPGFQAPQQGSSGNFPPASLIPEFGKPLPIDASSRGPAQGWSTNQPTNGTGFSAPNTSQDPNEARVTRLEKVAFGSSYPEHEVVDRVDHLEKEIFGKTSDGDLQSRIARLEAKLGGGGNFGSPMRNQSTAPPKDGSGERPLTADAGSAQLASLSSSAPASEEGTENGALSSQTRKGSVKPAIPYDKTEGDYLDQVSRFANNTTARWTHFPVRVRLPDDATSDLKKLMEPGIERWGRFIPLKTAAAEESADIEVSFVNHLVPRVLGVTRLTVTGGRMKVFVYMLRPSYYQNALNQRCLTVAFTHELGHAIGIFGHSDRQTDAMFRCEVAPDGKGKLTLEKLGTVSTRDVNTLKLIYDSQPLPRDFTLSAPQEWSLLEGAS